MDTTQKQDWRKGKKNWMLLGLGGDLMLIQVTNDMTSYFLCCVCKDGRDAVIEALVCEIMSGNMQGNDHLLWLVEININSRNNDSHANKITKGNAALYFYLEAYFCAVISTFTFRNLSFHKKWIPVHDKFQMSAHSFASLSWQESVITHALSCKLAIYSEAFWGFSNWLWGHWRGTWKSVGIKRLYMLFCIFQSHESFLLWPSLQLNLERNVRGSCCLCFEQLSKCLRFDSPICSWWKCPSFCDASDLQVSGVLIFGALRVIRESDIGKVAETLTMWTWYGLLMVSRLLHNTSHHKLPYAERPNVYGEWFLQHGSDRSRCHD